MKILMCLLHKKHLYQNHTLKSKTIGQVFVNRILDCEQTEFLNFIFEYVMKWKCIYIITSVKAK